MLNSKPVLSVLRGPYSPMLLLSWYVTFAMMMAISPVDRKVWLVMNILPFLFVSSLVLTYGTFPLSNSSYLAITVWLTLHTVAVHYTYPKVPLGFWIERWFDLHRNHFDRIVHFSFGFFLAYPLEEIFRRLGDLKGRLLTYVTVITILGFSAFWEIVEAWVGQIAHPDLEMALVGHQGDIWDPQKDMAAAFYGALLCVVLLAIVRKLQEPSPVLEPASIQTDPLGEV